MALQELKKLLDERDRAIDSLSMQVTQLGGEPCVLASALATIPPRIQNLLSTIETSSNTGGSGRPTNTASGGSSGTGAVQAPVPPTPPARQSAAAPMPPVRMSTQQRTAREFTIAPAPHAAASVNFVTPGSPTPTGPPTPPMRPTSVTSPVRGRDRSSTLPNKPLPPLPTFPPAARPESCATQSAIALITSPRVRAATMALARPSATPIVQTSASASPPSSSTTIERQSSPTPPPLPPLPSLPAIPQASNASKNDVAGTRILSVPPPRRQPPARPLRDGEPTTASTSTTAQLSLDSIRMAPRQRAATEYVDRSR